MPTTPKPDNKDKYLVSIHIQYIYIYIYILYIYCTYIHIHSYTHIHTHAGWVFTVKTNIEKAIQMPYNRIIQGIYRSDIIEKSFTRCTIDVMSLVILICNKKRLSSCLTKTNINKRCFSQTYWINRDILQLPNAPAKPGIISDTANSRSKLPTTL